MPNGWTQYDRIMRKAIGIAHDAIESRMPYSASRNSNYRADVFYRDDVHRLTSTALLLRADYGTVEYSCDAKRFEIRIMPGNRSEKKPAVSIMERHPVGVAKTPLDRDAIRALMRRWLEILNPSPNAHPSWTETSGMIGALAFENGAVYDHLEPHRLILPSAYADGSLTASRKTVARGGPCAKDGLDLDLSRNGQVAAAIAAICPTSRVHPVRFDHRGDMRLECDLSRPVELAVRIPDALGAIRSLAAMRERIEPNDAMSLAA